jgi:hypothetical protein
MLASASSGRHRVTLSELLPLVIGTLGAFLQIGGASWDVTSHLMLEPESFFTPSHTVLYSGIGLLGIASGIGGFMFFSKNKEVAGKSFTLAFKLLIVGSVVSLLAGPADFLWHEEFGVDGLLSPPHLALITGMLINSIAVVVGLVRIRYTHLNDPKKTITRLALVFAFAALWFTTMWCVYMFSLPFSNGENFQFNPNPYIGILIATISLPLLSSVVFLTAQMAIGRLGGAATVAGLVVFLNTLSNVVPTGQPMISFLPWYLAMAILPAVIAELALEFLPRNTKISVRKSQLISGAIIGSSFYMFSFPMITWVFSIPFGMNFASMEGMEAIGSLASDFRDTLTSTLSLTAVPGAIMGILGAILTPKIYPLSPSIRTEGRISNSTNMDVSNVAEKYSS